MQLQFYKQKNELLTRDAQLKCLRQRRFFALTGFPADMILTKAVLNLNRGIIEIDCEITVS